MGWEDVWSDLSELGENIFAALSALSVCDGWKLFTTTRPSLPYFSLLPTDSVDPVDTCTVCRPAVVHQNKR